MVGNNDIFCIVVEKHISITAHLFGLFKKIIILLQSQTKLQCSLQLQTLHMQNKSTTKNTEFFSGKIYCVTVNCLLKVSSPHIRHSTNAQVHVSQPLVVYLGHWNNVKDGPLVYLGSWKSTAQGGASQHTTTT